MTEQMEQARLEALRQTWRDYRALTEQQTDLPAIQLVAMRTDMSEMPVDELAFDLVIDKLRQEDQFGWARFRSGLAWSGATSAGDYRDLGPPIMAEWTCGALGSARLRVAPPVGGRGGPTAQTWQFQERPLGEDEGLKADEAPYLRESVRVLADARVSPMTHLDYSVYWGAAPDDSPHALKRLFDRFVGFSRQEDFS